MGDGSGAFSTVALDGDYPDSVFVYANANHDVSGQNSQDSSIGIYYVETFGTCNDPDPCKTQGRCILLGGGGDNCDVDGKVDDDDDVYNFGLRDELTNELQVGYVQTRQDVLEYRRGNTKGGGTYKTWNVRTLDVSSDSMNYLSFESFPSGAFAIYYLYTDVSAAPDSYIWTVSYTTDSTGKSGWTHAEMDTGDDNSVFDRIGVMGFDGEGYPYVARQSESLGSDMLEVYINAELDATGIWSQVSSIGPVPCTDVTPDYDRAILFENRPALLMYCQSGYLIFAKATNESAAGNWTTELVELDAHPEHTSMSTHTSGNDKPHISYLRANPTPSPSPGYSLIFLQSLLGTGEECFYIVDPP